MGVVLQSSAIILIWMCCQQMTMGFRSTGENPRVCSGGREWTTCGGCDRTCASLEGPGIMCLAVCRQKCQCPRDRPIWHHEACIPQDQCPARRCTGGQRWTECGSCDQTCDDDEMSCPAVCQQKCQCPRHRPVWHNGRCIRRNSCPATDREDGCTGGRVFNGCGSACTSTCSNPFPICTLQCVPGCQCPRDKHVWHQGRCVSLRECRVRPQDQAN